MSSISSVSTNGVDLYQWLSQIGQQPSSNQQDAVVAAQNVDGTPAAQNPAASSDETTQTHHHHHHGFSSKIESAVTAALQSAPSGSDPNQVVKDAIAQALQAGKPADPSSGDAFNARDQSGAGGAAAATGTVNGSSNSNTFVQLLSSYGINAQQFQQDVQDALSGQQTNGSGVDFATLFKSFPPGTLFQTTA